ncbi:MAG: hypothetical protein Q9195_008216 [Heterodermia aff. obscurata]
MPDFPPIRACIFDVDGLLINSEDIYSQTMNNVLHEYGLPDIPWSVKAMQQSRGRQGFINVMQWANLPIPVSEFQSKVNAQRAPFQNCELLPGVPQLLHNLSQRADLHLAIASSAERDFFKLKTDRFQSVLGVIPEAHRVFGHDPSMEGCQGKPAPDIFLQTLKRINDSLVGGEQIQPEQCLVFEDSIAGVEAGRAAGMRVVWVPHPGLLEVYKGREELVLGGLATCSSEGEIEERGGPIVAKDGRARLVTSLEDFPYKDYGLGVAG